jgi:hypothetical protein
MLEFPPNSDVETLASVLWYLKVGPSGGNVV